MLSLAEITIEGQRNMIDDITEFFGTVILQNKLEFRNFDGADSLQIADFHTCELGCLKPK